MNVSLDDIKSMFNKAYQHTCHNHNVGDINKVDISGIYEVLSSWDSVNYDPERTWKLYPFLIHADGGVKDFMIIFEVGMFKIILCRWIMFQDTDIPEGYDPFCKWLHELLLQMPSVKVTETVIFESRKTDQP